MKRNRYPITRYIIIDGKGSNKVCYWNSDVDKWLKECGLRITREEQFYCDDFNTTYIYVTNK